jgi:hypothetical protein
MGFWLMFFWLVSYPIGGGATWEAIKEKEKQRNNQFSLIDT